MFPNAKLIRIVPDAPGKGGMKTAVHSHQANPLIDTYNTFNCYVIDGRWRKARAPASIGTDQAAQDATFSVHVFYDYSTTNPTAAPTPFLLAHNYAVSGTLNTVYNATTGAAIHTSALPSLPANFANIKGRVFYAWGSEPGRISPDGVTDYPIGIVAPQTAPTYTLAGDSTYLVWVALNSPYISCVSPSPAWAGATGADIGLSVAVNGSIYKINAYTGFSATSGAGTWTNTAGAYSATVNAVWPANQAYGGLSVTVGGDTILVASYTTSATATTVTTQSPITSLHSAAAYTLTGSRFTLSANSVDQGWQVSAVVFRGSLTWSGAGPKYAYAYVDPLTGHVSNMSPILTVTEDDQAGITVTLANIDGSSEQRAYATRIFRTLLAGGSTLYQLTGGTGQPADLGYIYWGYFTTGSANVVDHPPASGVVAVMNGSATFTRVSGSTFEDTWLTDNMFIAPNNYAIGAMPTATTLTVSPVWPGANGNQAYSSVSSKAPFRYDNTTPPSNRTRALTDLTGKTIIVQDSDATTVQYTVSSWTSLGMTLNTTFNGTSGYYFFTVSGVLTGQTFVDTYQDYILNPLVPGPIDTNSEPEIDDEDAWPAHLAYWDSRVWINPTQAPSFLIYSADSAQAPVGVPEECFPAQNVLVIPAADGRVVGMKVIGGQLILTTERFAYTVQGFNETNYRLVRFAATMYGVGDYQMDELPADTGDSSNVVYLGRDKKLYVLSPGAGAISLSDPIATEISSRVSSVADYQACRVHVAHIEQRRLIILRLPGQCLAYDIERKVWSQFTPGGIVPTAFGTLYGGSRPVTELYGYFGTMKYWLSESVTTTGTAATVSTFSTGFTDVKGKKRLNFIRLLVSGDDSTSGEDWTVTVAVDDKTTAAYLLTQSALPYTAQIDAGPPINLNSADIYTIYPSGSVPIDGSGYKELIAFPFNAVYGVVPTAQAGLVEGFRFYVTITYPADTNPRDLAAFDICLSEIQDPRDVQP